MATRRKKPKAYRDGGAVPVAADVIAHADDAAAASSVDDAAIPPASTEAADAVARALEAQRRAEQLAIEQAAQPQHHQQQPAAPQMSERRRAFVEANPELADPKNAEAVMGYLSQAQRMGMHDEAEIDRYVLHGLRFERLHREPEAAPSHAEPPLARQEPRRSMPMTAPVSRNEAPTMSGKPRTSGTLSAEERQMAHAAIPDRPDLPKLTNHQKELMYLQNREKYRAMVADGSYDQQRQR